MISVFAAAAVLYVLFASQPKARRALKRFHGGLSRKLAAIGLASAAIVVLLHGDVWVAFCLFGAALWLLGQSARLRGASGLPPWHAPTSVMIQEEPGGRLAGRVLAGPLRGRDLDDLDVPQLRALHRFCLVRDAEGARLLEIYLDCRLPGWREAGHADRDPGQARARWTSLMSEDEAYEVLGLRRGESLDEVKRAHRSVMKRWHPDQGGTSDLAARANEAKEVLLRHHERNS